MTTSIRYCKSWFRAKKRATELWSVEQAEQAHRDRQPYAVLIGPEERPTHFLELNQGFVGVGFLDSGLREYLYYAFSASDQDRIFLGMAMFREFDGNSDRVAKGTSYIFKPTGELTILRSTFDPHTQEVAKSVVDVSKNYERRPKFGQYDAFLRVERSLG